MATFRCRCYRKAGQTSSLGPWISKTCGLLSMRDAAGAGSPGLLTWQLSGYSRTGAFRLAELGAVWHLALGLDGEITMAHPFSAVPLGFSVMGRDTPSPPASDRTGNVWPSQPGPHLPNLLLVRCHRT